MDKSIVKFKKMICNIDKEKIKSIVDIDNIRYNNIVDGAIISRYSTLTALYGERKADNIISNNLFFFIDVILKYF